MIDALTCVCKADGDAGLSSILSNAFNAYAKQRFT